MKFIAIALVTFFTFTANSADTPEYPAFQPVLSDFQVGEKWVWRFKGVTDQGEVRAEGRDIREVVDVDGALSIKSQYGTVAIADIVKPETSETPRYKWPLEVGKTWKYESHWESDDGTTGKTVQNARVISYQEETVGAGKFMAYTICYQGNISNSRGYSADTAETHLYAPKVKKFIKLIQQQQGYTYVEELEEYSIASSGHR